MDIGVALLSFILCEFGILHQEVEVLFQLERTITGNTISNIYPPSFKQWIPDDGHTVLGRNEMGKTVRMIQLLETLGQ